MIFFNDRRKAKKAASATTRAQIGAMAKQGTLRATTTSPGQREFGKAERGAVNKEVADVNRQWGPTDQPGITGSRAKRWDSATKKVDKAADVSGYDGPAYRKMDAEMNQRGQQKKYLPKKAGK
jgi:hypothetical protein